MKMMEMMCRGTWARCVTRDTCCTGSWCWCSCASWASVRTDSDSHTLSRCDHCNSHSHTLLFVFTSRYILMAECVWHSGSLFSPCWVSLGSVVSDFMWKWNCFCLFQGVISAMTIQRLSRLKSYRCVRLCSAHVLWENIHKSCLWSWHVLIDTARVCVSV